MARHLRNRFEFSGSRTANQANVFLKKIPPTEVCLNGQVQLATGKGWKDLCHATPGSKLLVILVIVGYSRLRRDGGIFKPRRLRVSLQCSFANVLPHVILWLGYCLSPPYEWCLASMLRK